MYVNMYIHTYIFQEIVHLHCLQIYQQGIILSILLESKTVGLQKISNVQKQTK